MKKLWRFSVSGQNADQSSFLASGVTKPCEFSGAYDEVMRETFHQLTNGRANYGHPGVGCVGPYTIRRFYFEEVAQ